MRMNAAACARCVRGAVANLLKHDGIEHAGYLAFLGLLALFPFLVLLVSFISMIGQGESGAKLIHDLLEALPHDLTAALRPRVEEIFTGPPQGLLTLSVLGALWTASSNVEGIRTILNRAYHVKAPPAYWLRRLLSVAQLLMFTFVMLSAMLAMVLFQLALSELEARLGIQLPEQDWVVWRALLYVVLTATVLVIVSAIYYTLPNVHIPLLSTLPGAGIVVIGWWGCAGVLTYYLSHFGQVSVIYGSLGSVIASLFFSYMCNIVFIFGAELNYLISREMGWRVEKTDDATQDSAA